MYEICSPSLSVNWQLLMTRSNLFWEKDWKDRQTKSAARYIDEMTESQITNLLLNLMGVGRIASQWSAQRNDEDAVSYPDGFLLPLIVCFPRKPII